jgi:hypothetical protein
MEFSACLLITILTNILLTRYLQNLRWLLLNNFLQESNWSPFPNRLEFWVEEKERNEHLLGIYEVSECYMNYLNYSLHVRGNWGSWRLHNLSCAEQKLTSWHVGLKHLASPFPQSPWSFHTGQAQFLSSVVSGDLTGHNHCWGVSLAFLMLEMAFKGEWWRGWIQLQYNVRTFVNVTMCPQHNNNKKN